MSSTPEQPRAVNIDRESLSTHFHRDEFACRGTACCGGSAPISDLIPRRLEELRAAIGEMLLINSGFRCRRYNATVPGSSATSKHCLGLAVDVECPRHLTPSEMALIAQSLDIFPGIIWYPARNFVHLDLRKKAPMFREIRT